MVGSHVVKSVDTPTMFRIGETGATVFHKDDDFAAFLEKKEERSDDAGYALLLECPAPHHSSKEQQMRVP